MCVGKDKHSIFQNTLRLLYSEEKIHKEKSVPGVGHNFIEWKYSKQGIQIPGAYLQLDNSMAKEGNWVSKSSEGFPGVWRVFQPQQAGTAFGK